MKIVCDSCSTKYSISDDKVRGKVFKIRCKKCSHIIVVRGTTEGAAPAPEAPTEGVWHLVVDGEQVGPLTDADVRARIVRGDVSSENYIWKEGFADWLKLGAIPDFQDALPQAPTSGELFSNGSSGADMGGDAGAAGFFGGGVAGQEARAMAVAAGGHSGPTSGRSGRNRAAGAAMAAAPAEEDAFSAPPPASLGADLFGAAPEPAKVRGQNGTGAARHDGGRVENLTAQRSENSVLF